MGPLRAREGGWPAVDGEREWARRHVSACAPGGGERDAELEVGLMHAYFGVVGDVGCVQLFPSDDGGHGGLACLGLTVLAAGAEYQEKLLLTCTSCTRSAPAEDIGAVLTCFCTGPCL